MDKLLIAIVGPTGIGKTKTAIELAEKFNGEIISADSRQIYRYMDIGTAKPSAEELNETPHHLINIINPDEVFSLALYQEMASKAVGDITSRGKLPILAGGSGLYVNAFIEGWDVPRIPPDYALREKLEQRAKDIGALKLHKELEILDPDAAKSIDYRNVRRVIRAIEACKNSEAPFSKLRKKTPLPYKILKIGLTTDRAKLYSIVDSRVDKMIASGLVEEVKHIYEMGFKPDLPSLNTIGYKEIGAYLKGEYALNEAIQKMKYETHRYIRQQYTWFKLTDESICWFDVQCADTSEKIASLVSGFISTK